MSIHYIPHLAVSGNVGHTKDGRQIVAPHLFLKAPLKLKQCGVLQVEHGQAARVAIAQRIADFALLAQIVDQIDVFCHAIEQSAKTNLFRASAASPPHNRRKYTKGYSLCLVLSKSLQDEELVYNTGKHSPLPA